MKKLVFKITGGIIVLVLLLSTTGICATKQELTEKVNETKEQLNDVKEEKSGAMKEIDNLTMQIEDYQSQINELDGQIAGLNTKIDESQAKLDEAQENYTKQEKLLEERLVATYMAGETSYLDFLLSSDSITDLISNYYLVSEIATADTQLLEKIQKQKEEIEEAKKTLEDSKQELAKSKESKQSVSAQLQTVKKEKDTQVANLEGEEKQLQSEIDNYNAQIAKIDADIAAAYKRAMEQQSSSSGSSGGTQGAAGLQFDGSFIWPCNNKTVTSRVKWRWGRWHKGIDIGASYENVYASASGYAFTLENPGGFGHYIMIVHGSGYITLYGHLNTFKVSNGQYVSQGQVIAQSGNSGGNYAPHLHFEIRKATSVSNYYSSSFLNPLNFLPGGYTITDY